MGDRRARARSPGASAGADRREPPTSLWGTTGSGSARVIAERKIREGDPIVAVLEAKEREARPRPAAHPDDQELAALRDWLAAFLVFVRLFDRAVGLVPQVEPRELERSLGLLGRIPDATILRLFDLLGGLPGR